MERTHTLKSLIFSIACLLSSASALAEEPEQEHLLEGLESFFAISAVGGVSESNLVDQNYQRVDATDTFLGLNLEIQLRWNGFFYENPGHSQENVDGLFSGDALGYTFYNSKHWAVDAYAVNTFQEGEYFFEGSEETVDPETNAVTTRIERLVLPRNSNNRFGLRATGYYQDYLAQFIFTPGTFNSEVGGFNASASLRRTWLYRNWNFFGTIGLNYHSKEIIDYYWGLTEAESAQIADILRDPDNPFTPYEATGGMFAVGQLGFEYPVTENIVFGGFVTAVRRPNSVTESPMTFEGRFITTAGLSLTWVF